MISNIEKKKSQFYTEYLHQNSQNNYTNFETPPINSKNSTIYNSKKDLNINDFVNQKNKFYMPVFFNERETNKFLDSKKRALMEINLDDDKNISNNEYEIEINKMNNNVLKTELKNKSDIEENNQQIKKKNKVRLKKGKSVNPKRKRGGSKKANHNKNNNDNNFYRQLFTMDDCDKNDGDDTNESNFIYKFIIDNANETEEKFLKKLKKEIKRVETKKEIKPKKNSNVIIKSLTIKNIDIKKKNYKSDINPFDFSETAKNLMTKEDIEVSSIGKDDISTIEKEKNPIKSWKTMYKTGKAKKNLLDINEINEKNKNNNISQNGSDKKSLINLLSELI